MFEDIFKSVGDAVTNGLPRLIDAEVDRKITVRDPANQTKVSDVTGQPQKAGTIAPPAGITQQQAIMIGGAVFGVVVLILLLKR